VRVIGLDLGSKRIGVACSDATGTLASPVTTIVRTGDPLQHRRSIQALVDEYQAELVVVGLPLSLSGAVGPAADAALIEVDALRLALSVPVSTIDERFTTTEAHLMLGAAGRNSRERRSLVDKSAAALLLQAFLDRRHE